MNQMNTNPDVATYTILAKLSSYLENDNSCAEVKSKLDLVKSLSATDDSPWANTMQKVEVVGGDLHAVAFKVDNKIVISFRGSQFFKSDDFTSQDLSIFLDQHPGRIPHLEKFIEKIKNENPNCEVEYTGHSLGGAFSKIFALREGATCYAFNSPPLSFKIYQGVINEKSPQHLQDAKKDYIKHEAVQTEKLNQHLNQPRISIGVPVYVSPDITPFELKNQINAPKIHQINMISDTVVSGSFKERESWLNSDRKTLESYHPQNTINAVTKNHFMDNFVAHYTSQPLNDKIEGTMYTKKQYYPGKDTEVKNMSPEMASARVDSMGLVVFQTKEINMAYNTVTDSSAYVIGYAKNAQEAEKLIYEKKAQDQKHGTINALPSSSQNKIIRDYYYIPPGQVNDLARQSTSSIENIHKRQEKMRDDYIKNYKLGDNYFIEEAKKYSEINSILNRISTPYKKFDFEPK